MAFIFIKGNSEPVEVKDEFARKADIIWRDCVASRKHEAIDFGTISVLTSEIKAISFDLVAKDDFFEKKILENRANRDSFKALSLKEKAEKGLEHFKLFYLSFIGKKEITEEQKQYILKDLEKFFENNPDWCVPSLKIYEKVYKKNDQKRELNVWEQGVVRGLLVLEQTELQLTEHKPIVL